MHQQTCIVFEVSCSLNLCLIHSRRHRQTKGTSDRFMAASRTPLLITGQLQEEEEDKAGGGEGRREEGRGGRGGGGRRGGAGG